MKHAKAKTAVRKIIKALGAVGNAIVSAGIVIWFVSVSITVAAFAIIAAALIDGWEALNKWSQDDD